MTTTLITGANKGLGYETARRLIAEGHDVWVGARDRERGRAAAEELGARFVALDVTDDASVGRRRRETVGELDVLVNNAGIVGGHGACPGGHPGRRRARAATNVVGLVRVTQAFVPAAERSANPVIVNVSTGMGSIGVTSDPERLESTLVGLQYPASKAAVNMLTTQYAKALPGMRVNCRRSRLHGDRLQPAPRPPDGRAGRRRDRADGVARRVAARPAPTSTTRARSRGRRSSRVGLTSAASVAWRIASRILRGGYVWGMDERPEPRPYLAEWWPRVGATLLDGVIISALVRS